MMENNPNRLPASTMCALESEPSYMEQRAANAGLLSATQLPSIPHVRSLLFHQSGTTGKVIYEILKDINFLSNFIHRSSE